MKQLTTKQAAILNYIMDCVEQNGYPPSIRQVQTQFGIGTVRGAVIHLDALKQKGYITRGREAREITVLFDPNGGAVITRYVATNGR